ncbi:MAG: MBL fold metallo-hydrolase [Betaproteobacteria bacterium]|jgi:ribonuclease Z|nr:MBL fold metallo-hydrolase [Betaproteobacteria bacterium]
MFIRKFALATALLVVLAVGPVQAQFKVATPSSDFKVTLLGTGSPAPIMKRFGPGTLVQVGGQNLLFDAGRGVTQRLYQVGQPMGKIDALFLTHLHSDHVVGIPDVWLTGWLRAAYARRDAPFRVFGPEGTANLTEGLQKAYAWDIETRIADQGLKREAVSIDVTEFDKEGVIYEKDGVKVSSIEVNHGDKVKPAFGYRIDYGGRSVVISGDTKFNENLIKHATGVDLLIHQVAAMRPDLLKIPVFKVIMAHHTSPEEAGVVFARAKPKLAVYYHFVIYGNPKIPPYKEQDVIDLTRKNYSGPLLIGQDLMAFDVTKDEVKVMAPPNK